MPRKSPTHTTSSSHTGERTHHAYTFRATDAEVLSNVDEVLFRASVELASRQAQLRRGVIGRRVDEYRGTVSEVNSQSFKIKMDDGSYRSVPMSIKRASQLLSIPSSTSPATTAAAAGGGAHAPLPPHPPSTTTRK